VAPGETLRMGTGPNAGYPVRKPDLNEFVSNEDPHLEPRYRDIRNATDDVPKVADSLDLHDDDPAKLAELEEVVDAAKRNMFVNTHDVAIGPNDIRHGNFPPLPEIGELWQKAMSGRPLSNLEKNQVRSLVAHEYVEAKLLELGQPYKLADPEAWRGESDSYQPAKPGPHELAPLSARGGEELDLLLLWKQYGLTSPFPGAFRPKDLSKANLDAIVQAIKEQMGW
jgi:hypothetical protein